MVFIPEKFKENCKDYGGYKKGELRSQYSVKCGKKIIKSEQKEYDKFYKKDDDFSKKKKLREEDVNDLLQDLQKYLDCKSDFLCKEGRKNVLDCVKDNGIIKCQRYVDDFISCVNETVKEIYEQEYRRKMEEL